MRVENSEQSVVYEFDLGGKLRRFQCYHIGGSVTAVTNVRTSAKSGKFTFNVRSDSGILSTNGCHLSPKSANFGTLTTVVTGEVSLHCISETA